MGIRDMVARAFCKRAENDQASPMEPVDAAEPPEGPVSAEEVLLGCSFATRDDALRALSKHAVDLGIASDPDELMDAFLEREAEGTTGMMDSFAIPHAKSASISRVAVLVAKSRRDIGSWETMDGVPVRVVIALLVPDDQANTEHLRMLAKMAEALMDEGFRTRLRRSDDVACIAAEVNRHLR